MSSPPSKRVCLNVFIRSPLFTTNDNSKVATIDIHPDGDIVLNVGTGINAQSLRVSSGVLTAASAFFVELFGANLKENSSPFNAADPKHVPMNDDDPQAVLDLCNLLHYRSDQVMQATDRRLMDLALLCDKYDCITAIKLWMNGKIGLRSRSALRLASPVEPPLNQLPVLDVMALAYLFDNPKYFWLASRPLVAIKHLSPELQAVLPAALIAQTQTKNGGGGNLCACGKCSSGDLQQQRQAGCVSLTARKGLERPLICKPSLHKFAFYMGCLNNVGLWPVPDNFDDDPSVEETLKQLARVAREKRPGRCSGRPRACKSCNQDVESLLGNVVERFKTDLTGLCLRCVQKGDYTSGSFSTYVPNAWPAD